MKSFTVLFVGMATALVLMLVSFSCSTIKPISCSRKYVNVHIISDYGNYDMQLPYCDTIRLGKPPDSLYLKIKNK